MRGIRLRYTMWGIALGSLVAVVAGAQHAIERSTGLPPEQAGVGFALFVAPIMCFPFGSLAIRARSVKRSERMPRSARSAQQILVYSLASCCARPLSIVPARFRSLHA